MYFRWLALSAICRLYGMQCSTFGHLLCRVEMRSRVDMMVLRMMICIWGLLCVSFGIRIGML